MSRFNLSLLIYFGTDCGLAPGSGKIRIIPIFARWWNSGRRPALLGSGSGDALFDYKIGAFLLWNGCQSGAHASGIRGKNSVAVSSFPIMRRHVLPYLTMTTHLFYTVTWKYSKNYWRKYFICTFNKRSCPSTKVLKTSEARERKSHWLLPYPINEQPVSNMALYMCYQLECAVRPIWELISMWTNNNACSQSLLAKYVN